MNRDEFLQMLAFLVDEGRIPEETASGLLRQFDAGDLDLENFPLRAGRIRAEVSGTTQLFSTYRVGEQGYTGTQAVQQQMREIAEETGTAQILQSARDESKVISALDEATGATARGGAPQVLTVSLTSGEEVAEEVITTRIGPASIDEAYSRSANILRQLSDDAARRTAVEITTSFEEQARAVTRAYKDNRLNLQQWQNRMMSLIREDAEAQAITGSGSRLTPAQREAVEEVIEEQRGFLRRFAEEVGSRRGTNNPMSTAKMSDRARQYGGRGYEQFYERSEEALNRGDDTGTVVDYNAVDDGATCQPCIDAEQGGPYLPGEGPMPGIVCLANGKCRCTRTPRQDEQAYQRLVS